MVHINVEQRIIFVRGPYRHGAIVRAVLEATGRKRWMNRDDWLITAIPDEEAQGLATGMPFDSPTVEHQTVGFRYGKSNNDL